MPMSADIQSKLRPGRVVLPASVESHPDLICHQQQRTELAASLHKREAERDRLVADRNQLVQDQQAAEVAALLGEVPASGTTPDIEVRLSQLDAQIAAATSRLVPARLALETLDRREPDVRARVVSEMQGQVMEASRGIITAMAKQLREASALNEQLYALQALGTGAPIPASYWPELRLESISQTKLATWLREAREGGLDV